MKIATLTSCLLLAATAFPQQKNSFPDLNSCKSVPGRVLYEVSGEEIRRFPSMNFRDAVNSLFPGIFSQTVGTNNYLFVVNGFVFMDINGISLYDIDKIVYTRNNLNGSLYPFSRAGIFYITTKKEQSRKPVIQFNTQYNTVWNKDSRIYYPTIYTTQPEAEGINNHSSNKAGHWINNHLSFATGNDKIRFNSSLQWDESKKPSLSQTVTKKNGSSNDSLMGNSSSRQYNLRAFAGVDYKFSEKLQAGIAGNYVHNRGNSKLNDEWHPYMDGSYNKYASSGLSHIDYYQFGGFVNWELFPGLRNKLLLEYGNRKYKSDMTSDGAYYPVSQPAQQTNSLMNSTASMRLYTLRNHLEYDVLAKGKFTAGTGVVFSYTYNKFSSNQGYVQYSNNSGIPMYASSSTSNYLEKLTTLNPQIYFSYDSIVTGYAGYGFLLNKGISRFTGRSKSNPYAGLSFDLHKAMRLKSQLSRLELSVNYGDMNRNQSETYWLGEEGVNITQSNQGLLSGPIFSGNVPILPNPALANVILKNRLTAITLQVGFINNRLLAGLEWSELNSQNIYIVNFGSTTYPVNQPILGENIRKGFSGYISAKLIDKPGLSWNTRLNVFFPSEKEDVPDAPYYTYSYYPFDYNSQAGWQNTVSIHAWFLQLNTTFSTNDTYYISQTTSAKKKLKEFAVPYLIIGYNIPTDKSSILDNVTFFVQARNLVASKEAQQYYQYDRFAGIGMDVRFK